MSRKVFFKLIVPNYNNLPYIKKCLDSIVQQTFQDFICVVVDDMSTDLSDKFVEYYERRFPGKVKLIKHTEKKYAGGARNTGLAYDKYESDYIWFIDSDDWLADNDVLQKMHDFAVENNYPDIFRIGANWNFNKNMRYKRGQSDLKLIIENTWSSVWWNCISSKLADIKFQEYQPIYNDVLWFTKVLDRVSDNQMLELKDACYVYNRISSTSCHNTFKDSDKKEALAKIEAELLAYKPSNKWSAMFIDTFLEKVCKTKSKRSSLLKYADDNEYFFRIIIPNYNNMPYIKKCLDSLLSQSFQDFKIIIVDDMSTDMSDKFCETYSHKYEDKILFIKAEKKLFAGGCRNLALDVPIKSKYTWFIDGDDYIDTPFALEKLYECAKSLEYDLICFQYVPEFQGKRRKNRSITHTLQYFVDNNMIARCPWNGPVAKITKSEKIPKFLTDCNYGEDAYQWICFWDTSPTYMFLKELLYIYTQNPNSTMHSDKYLNDREKFYSNLKKLQETCKTDLVRNSIQYRIDNFYYKTTTD